MPSHVAGRGRASLVGFPYRFSLAAVPCSSVHLWAMLWWATFRRQAIPADTALQNALAKGAVASAEVRRLRHSFWTNLHVFLGSTPPHTP